MFTRRCRHCHDRTLHRVRRNGWQRVVGYVLPIRPYRCAACGRRPWGTIHHADGRLPWLTSALAAGAVIGLTVHAARLWSEGGSEESRALALKLESRLNGAAAHQTSPRSELQAGEAPTDAIGGSASSGPVAFRLRSSPLEHAVPEIAAAAVAPAEPGPSPEDASLAVERFDVRRVDEVMEIRIAVRGGAPPYRVSELASVRGYVVDLPGRWTLPPSLRMSRSFTRTPLQTLRIGRHSDYLRLVLGMRDGAVRAPRIEMSGDELLIRVGG